MFDDRERATVLEMLDDCATRLSCEDVDLDAVNDAVPDAGGEILLKGCAPPWFHQHG